MIVKMRTTILLVCLAVGTLHAQNNLTNAAVQRYFNPVRRNLEASAELMPADKYSFRLTSGQNTFAEWINHSSERNYRDCSTLRSEPQPEALKRLPSLKEKAEVTQALKDSFAYCAAALDKMDDQKAGSSPEMRYTGNSRSPRCVASESEVSFMARQALSTIRGSRAARVRKLDRRRLPARRGTATLRIPSNGS